MVIQRSSRQPRGSASRSRQFSTRAAARRPRQAAQTLTTIQMFVALDKERGPGLWKSDWLLLRDTARFNLEFARMGQMPEANIPAVVFYWGVLWPTGDWSGELNNRIADGTLNRDVLPPGSSGVNLFNLILQLDRVAGIETPVGGVPEPRIQCWPGIHWPDHGVVHDK